MKGTLLLAEFATAHPDGTVSLLRAGITHVWGRAGPVAFQGMFQVRIEPDIGDLGSHVFDLRCMDQDGAEVLPKLQGGFEARRGGGVLNFVLAFGVEFRRFGRYQFVLRIDNVQCDVWTVTAGKHPSDAPPGAGSGQGGQQP